MTWWLDSLRERGNRFCPCCQALVAPGWPVAYAVMFSANATWLCLACAERKGIPLKPSRRLKAAWQARPPRQLELL